MYQPHLHTRYSMYHRGLSGRHRHDSEPPVILGRNHYQIRPTMAPRYESHCVYYPRESLMYIYILLTVLDLSRSSAFIFTSIVIYSKQTSFSYINFYVLCFFVYVMIYEQNFPFLSHLISDDK